MSGVGEKNMENNGKLWQTKLAARLHDPAEKALVLMRDPAGHEGGTVKDLRELLSLDAADDQAVKRADWWSSAADRPQWPDAKWSRVYWTSTPELIHPLSGERADMQKVGALRETEIGDIKNRSFAHFKRLMEGCKGDLRKTLLAFWRFGPVLTEEEDNGKLGELWGQLPADSRVPDHTIWDHLDLTSAFAGAFAADSKGEVALLALSIGPVQPFIASARSTSDLWAGSHLLARLSWEVMKPIVDALGPDAILFPRLRGIPQVDLWLRDDRGLPADWFKNCQWNRGATDDNPLFAAALPNRFVAIVPVSQAKKLAEQCRDHVRNWLQDKGKEVMDRLLKAAKEEQRDDLDCYAQLRRQLAGFPEVHWASVPFSLIRPRNEARQTDLDVSLLSENMAPFFGVAPGQPCGFLDTPAWEVLRKEIDWKDGTRFFAPNPGVLYPAVYDLAERVLAAAKSVRAFSQSEEQGWRCSLTGETEWLTTDKEQLSTTYRQQSDTLWAKIAKERPAWAKKGEHLGALPAIKRLWPTLFSEEVAKATGQESIGRFVVSTHTMALAKQLDQWLEHGGLTADGFREAIESNDIGRVALPRKLMRQHKDQFEALKDASHLPALLERAAELDDANKAEKLRKIVRNTLNNTGQDNEAGSFTLETYYGLLMLDGDHMGRILSGDEKYAISYLESFHRRVAEKFAGKMTGNDLLQAYGNQKRAVSPNRHLAISGALNDFSMQVVPHVVHEEYAGRLIYAGGDDVLAMLPVADLLPAAARLRQAWSGASGAAGKELMLDNGFALLHGRLLRMMGNTATASAGLVVAHHQTPLARVLRELREAESAAKNAGRNRFQLRIIKRSGGALNLTLEWGEPLALLNRLMAFLRDPAVSRRAVYHSLVWLKDLPEPTGDGAMLAELLAYQLARQTDNKVAVAEHKVDELSRELARVAAAQENGLDWLANFLSVAEFLARETRMGGVA